MKILGFVLAIVLISSVNGSLGVTHAESFDNSGIEVHRKVDGGSLSLEYLSSDGSSSSYMLGDNLVGVFSSDMSSADITNVSVGFYNGDLCLGTHYFDSNSFSLDGVPYGVESVRVVWSGFDGKNSYSRIDDIYLAEEA